MGAFSILRLLLGLSFFLYGMRVLSGSLEQMTGGRLEQLLKKMTANAPAGLLLGALAATAVQSSSAITVLLVGLVNSGILHFSQTLYVLFGANIGTTLTAWILSLTGIEGGGFWIEMLKPQNFSPILAVIGVILLNSRRGKSVGTVLLGFSVLMYGMELMQEAVSPLAESPDFGALLTRFSNPVLGILAGALITALLQSSSASIGILQAISLTGGVTYKIAIPLIMGQNIGTCVTVLLSCIGAGKSAKRVAAAHLSINVLGTGICLLLYGGLFRLPFASQAVNPAAIALLHTLFNLITTVFLLPFSKLLLRLVKLLVRGGAEERPLLDTRLLRAPAAAVQAGGAATEQMGRLAQRSVELAVGLLSHFDRESAAEVRELEEQLDRMEDQLGSFLVQLSASPFSAEGSRGVTRMLHAIGDFERIGDHSVNILNAAEELHNKHLTFSPAAERELATLAAAVREILALTLTAFEQNSPIRAGEVEPLEQVVDQLAQQIRSRHIDRLQHGECTIETGFVLSDLLTNFKRISDHCSNLAVAVIELSHDSFDTHRYLTGVKYGDPAFEKAERIFAKKYQI